MGRVAGKTTGVQVTSRLTWTFSVRAVRGRSRPAPLAEEAGLELMAEAELERGYAFEAVLLMGDA
ncbi:hypothetical protein, partial [Streptomyces sp. NPDC052127]|uniref:hypothetical protein n=1 Tax=Streptomyces sp. NPDC052127 TaxID=3155679 RepID=UPI003429F057